MACILLRGTLVFLFSVFAFQLAAQDSLSVRTPREMPVFASDSIRNQGLPYMADYDSLRITMPADSLVAEVDSAFIRRQLRREYRKTKPVSPNRALILSAILPGLGQAYVGKYWKIPIIYGAGIGVYYFFDVYNDKFNYYKNQYEIENAAGGGNANTYKSYRDEYAQNRNNLIIAFGALYLLNLADAMTDAYFRQYDISEELSLRIKPTISSTPILVNNTASSPAFHYGISLSFGLK